MKAPRKLPITKSTRIRSYAHKITARDIENSGSALWDANVQFIEAISYYQKILQSAFGKEYRTKENEFTAEEAKKLILDLSREAQISNINTKKGSDKEILQYWQEFINIASSLSKKTGFLDPIVSADSKAGTKSGQTGCPRTIDRYPKGHSYWKEKSAKSKKTADELYEEKATKTKENFEKGQEVYNVLNELKKLGVLPIAPVYPKKKNKLNQNERVAWTRAWGNFSSWASNSTRIAEKHKQLKDEVDRLRAIVEPYKDRLLKQESALGGENFHFTQRSIKQWKEIRNRFFSIIGENRQRGETDEQTASRLKNQFVESIKRKRDSNLYFWLTEPENHDIWLDKDYLQKFADLYSIIRKFEKSNPDAIVCFADVIFHPIGLALEDYTRPTLIEKNDGLYLKVDSPELLLFVYPTKQQRRLKIEEESSKKQICSWWEKGKKIKGEFKSVLIQHLGKEIFLSLVFEIENTPTDQESLDTLSYLRYSLDKSPPKKCSPRIGTRALGLDKGLNPLGAFTVYQYTDQLPHTSKYFVTENGGYAECIKEFRYGEVYKRWISSKFKKDIRKTHTLLSKMAFLKNWKSEIAEGEKNKKIAESFAEHDLSNPEYREKLYRELEQKTSEKVSRLKKYFQKHRSKNTWDKQESISWIDVTKRFISLLTRWMDRHQVEIKPHNHERCSNYWKYYNNLRDDSVKKFASRVVAYAIKNKCGIIVIENLDNFKPTTNQEKAKNRLLSIWGKQRLYEAIVSAAEPYGIVVERCDPKYTSQIHAHSLQPGKRKYGKLYTESDRPCDDQINGSHGIQRVFWTRYKHLQAVYCKPYNNQWISVADGARIRGAIKALVGKPHLCLIENADKTFSSSGMTSQQFTKIENQLVGKKGQKFYQWNGVWLTKSDYERRIEKIKTIEASKR